MLGIRFRGECRFAIPSWKMEERANQENKGEKYLTFSPTAFRRLDINVDRQLVS